MTPTMESLTSIEPSPDHIIRDLHRIREALAESYGGDLQAFSKNSYRKALELGWPVWQGTGSAATTTLKQDAPKSSPSETAAVDGIVA